MKKKDWEIGQREDELGNLIEEKAELEAGYLGLKEKLEDQEGVGRGAWVLENKGLGARISSLEKDLDLACQVSEGHESQNLV